MSLHATCHCRAHRIPITLPSSLPHEADCCHCSACRQSTGVPFAVYLLLAAPPFPSLSSQAGVPVPATPGEGAVADEGLPKGIRAYKTSEPGTRYFCETCGCHLAMRDDKSGKWFVTVGSLEFSSAGSGSQALTGEEEVRAVENTYTISWHQYLADTVDGGFSRMLPDGLPRFSVEKNSAPFHAPSTPGPINPAFRVSEEGKDVLRGQCRCGGVRALILRPSAKPDGPGLDEASADRRRWLTAPCFCIDCRLTSGFPLMSWTYPGRQHLTWEGEHLVYYKSSERVRRGFCGRCGASVSWDGGHDTVDVATALFERAEGEGVAGVEEDWTFLDELSYPEDARDRVLLQALEKGMKENAGKGK